MKLKTFLFGATLFLGVSLHGKEITQELWSEGAPEKEGFVAQVETEAATAGGFKKITHVSRPTLTVYKPTDPAKANGTAVLICPGGGYNVLAIEHEGTRVADYLNTLGVTGIVLKYRVPRRDQETPHEAPLADAKQAMTLIRTHAKEWGIDPTRVGIMGFSAGGHLSMVTALHTEAAQRPNFLVAVYPAYITTGKGTSLTPEIKLTKTAPPACFIHAGDDRYTAAGSALAYLEYKKLGIPAELHIYAKGGHGFGIKEQKKEGSLPAHQWQVRVGEWLKAGGWLK